MVTLTVTYVHSMSHTLHSSMSVVSSRSDVNSFIYWAAGGVSTTCSRALGVPVAVLRGGRISICDSNVFICRDSRSGGRLGTIYVNQSLGQGL